MMNDFELKHLKKVGRELIKGENYAKSQVFALRAKFVTDAYAKGKGCSKCGRKEMLTVDHIVPLSILIQLGVDVEHEYCEEDLDILCRPCNQYKQSRLDFTNPKTKEIMLKYLNKL